MGAILRDFFKKNEEKEPLNKMSFCGFNYYYSDMKTYRDNYSDVPEFNDLEYEYDITEFKGFDYDKLKMADKLMVFKNSKDIRALMFFVSIPTFDSCDREWDSYRRFYLVPVNKSILGIFVSGGYKIAEINTYSNIRCADENTKNMLKSTNIFENCIL